MIKYILTVTNLLGHTKRLVVDKYEIQEELLRTYKVIIDNTDGVQVELTKPVGVYKFIRVEIEEFDDEEEKAS